MMSKLRLAAVACALGSSAVNGQGRDVTELVQSDFRIHGPGAVSLQRHTGHAYRVKSKTLAKGLLRAFLSDGRRWSKLFWGNATEGEIAEPVPADNVVGCSEQDRQSAASHMDKMMENFQQKLEEVMPSVMEKAMAGQMGMGNAPALPFATPFGTGDAEAQAPGEINIDMSDLIKLPEECEGLLNQKKALNWEGIMECAQEVLGVSATCLGCIPQFGAQVKDACEQMCASSVTEAGTAMENAIHSATAKLNNRSNAAFGGFGGGMPSQQDMQAVVESAQEGLTGAMKIVASCGECVLPKATSFAGCVGGEEAAKFVQEQGEELVGSLKSGDLLRVEIDPSMGGAEQEEQDMIM